MTSSPAMPFPSPERWRQAVAQTAPALAADPVLLEQVVERFLEKYLQAILIARTPSTEERAWEGFYFWLVFPATDRRPFAVPEPEAQALLTAFRSLVEEFKHAVRRKP